MATYTAMTQERIDSLNRRASRRVVFGHQPDALKACYAVAERAGLEQVAGDAQSLILRDPRTNEYVNLWIDGIVAEVREGGLGFDSQIDWWVERQARLGDMGGQA